MNWGVVGTIIVISVMMWFLSNLFRGGEDERAKDRPDQQPRRNPGGRPRSAGADIDRFLEEINRRRKQAAERQPAKPAQALPIPVARPRRPKPTPRPVSVPAVLPVGRAERRPGIRRPTDEPVLAIVLDDAAKPAVALPVPAVPVAAAPEPVLPTSLTTIAAVSVKAQPPALTQLTSLLRTPQTLRTAVLLHEILGPPRCRRR